MALITSKIDLIMTIEQTQILNFLSFFRLAKLAVPLSFQPFRLPNQKPIVDKVIRKKIKLGGLKILGKSDLQQPFFLSEHYNEASDAYVISRWQYILTWLRRWQGVAGFPIGNLITIC